MGKPPFVTRERELGQLTSYLDRVRSGQGQVCFISGEAGRGKTTLVNEFTRRAQEQYADLVSAVGQSDAQTGAGDAYLPFREILAQLTGDVEMDLARGTISEENATRLRDLLRFSGRALVEVGPDLIGAFVPGAGLAMRVGAFVADKAGWLKGIERLAERRPKSPGDKEIEQGQIFEQYTNVLRRLAEKQALILILDDLQWADGASIDLLFRLGRRIQDRRILIVGAYRPDEVALGRGGERHPLDKVIAEFKRYYGEILIDLNHVELQEERHFVDALLDTEPNRLGEGFRRALCQHTGGHALFTIELLRAMQERGDLVQDESGRWVEGPAIDWATLPQRVEGVIEERIGRLGEELRQALTVASVEGAEFTAEVVAAVQAVAARELARRLGRELEQRHRLVSSQGVLQVGPQRLTAYRFQHSLFQQYLYHSLNEAERAYLHQDVGNALETLYGAAADDIAVQLARHFAEARIDDRAAHYMQQAGEQAAARFANAEAVGYFTRALDLVPAADAARCYPLLLARERVYDVLGKREEQQKDLAALQEMAAAAGLGAEVALRCGHYAEVTGNYDQAIAAAQAAIQQIDASETDDSQAQMRASAYLQWGRALWRQGDYPQAHIQLLQALELARSHQLQRMEANSLRALGGVLQYQGDYEAARQRWEEALAIYRRIGDRRGESATLNNLGVVSNAQGDYAQSGACYEQALYICREIGDRRQEGLVLNNLGIVCRFLGDGSRAWSCCEQALQISREIGDRQLEGKILDDAGVVLQQLGRDSQAQAHYEQALHVCRAVGYRRGECSVLSNMGLLFHHLGDDESALTYAQQALQIAREVGDRSLEGDAWTHLGHAHSGMGRLAAAEEAYRQALAVRRELGEGATTLAPLAGLVLVALERGQIDQAMEWSAEILADMQANPTLTGTEEPFRVYLACYRVLKAAQDPRAAALLATAHNLLQERAAAIEDQEKRVAFLTRSAVHREILNAMTEMDQS
ncbi:MAG: tetratricopeptide repeat protein [Anaerolineae bacterium]|nr:tetratricopeptide repeat protein [Anaerolineae bacterium]